MPDEDGYCNALETALDTLRGTPYNMKLIIGRIPISNKNVLERVHASPTMNTNRGQAAFPAKAWRLVDGDITGIPPCEIASLEFRDQFKMSRGKPVANLQVLLSIADTGEGRGASAKDGDLVRMKRKAICCLSGRPVVLLRSGDLASMSKYLCWEQGAIIFNVGRLRSLVEGVPHLAIKGSNRFPDPASAMVFNAYLTRYCDLTATVPEQKPSSMDHSWTPKRRRQELSDDGDFQSQLTPMTSPPTPVKFQTP